MQLIEDVRNDLQASNDLPNMHAVLSMVFQYCYDKNNTQAGPLIPTFSELKLQSIIGCSSLMKSLPRRASP